jgi:hypothetical protein
MPPSEQLAFSIPQLPAHCKKAGAFCPKKEKNSSFEPHNIFSIAHRRAFVKRKTGNVTIFRRLPKFAPEASVMLPS